MSVDEWRYYGAVNTLLMLRVRTSIVRFEEELSNLVELFMEHFGCNI